MNAIAVRLRDYDNCHDGDIDAAADEIDRLEKVIADQRKELDARETILNQIQEACGSGWWSGAIDSIKNLKEEVMQQKEAIKSLKSNIEDLEYDMDILEEDLSEKDELIAKMESRIDHLKSAIFDPDQ